MTAPGTPHNDDGNDGMVTPTLARLVRDRKEATGKSYRQIAADSGIAVSTVHKMANGMLHQVPGPRIAEGMARALGLDPQVLLDAIAHDLGVRKVRIEDAEATTIYLAVKDLDPDQQHILVLMVNDMRKRAGLPLIPNLGNNE